MQKTHPPEIVVVYAVGARPNIVKVAPVLSALDGRKGFKQIVVHTGQHYDSELFGDIVADLDFPRPDISLGIGSGSHAQQVGRTLMAFEEVLETVRPSLVVVAGDVNATLACSLAAAKLGVPIAHIESGLRSRDRTMPEEINRVLTDHLSDFLFIHSPDARENLLAEGCPAEKIHYVGNTMIDSLRRLEGKARAQKAWEQVGVEAGEYVLVTLHRPSNVDQPDCLAAIVDELLVLSQRAPVIFPVHPRTRERLRDSGRLEQLERSGVHLLGPVRYLDFLSLETEAGAILTDSGGVQEEASALGIPCFTLRPNTERPITISQGTNTLLGDDPEAIRRVRLLQRSSPAIPFWDGHAGARVAEVIETTLGRGAAD
jgi:UDP-N-acetylglucosamine 2-epimerase (non-hydrolysing)